MAQLQSLCRPLSLVAKSVVRTRTGTALALPLAPGQRCFSQFAPLRGAQVGKPMSMPRTKIKSEASIQSHRGRDTSKLETEDIGLFPSTYVPSPFFSGPENPTSFRSILHFLKAQTLRRLVLSAREFFMILYVYYTLAPTTKPGLGFWKSIFAKRPFEIRPSKTVEVAKRLHAEMYNSLAQRDATTIKEICVAGGGLSSSLRARIAARPRDEQMTWELVKYNRPHARVVSHCTLPLPGFDGGVFRQAVVRIASTQRLTRRDKAGRILEGSGNDVKVVEYLCIQKVSLKWKEGPWKIWGTTQPTSESAVKEKQKAGTIPSWV